MFTTKEKTFLLQLIDKVQITGTRKTILKTVEELDALARKIDEFPEEGLKQDAKEQPKKA